MSQHPPQDHIRLYLTDQGIPIDTARCWADAILELLPKVGVVLHSPDCDRRWHELNDRLRIEGPLRMVQEQTLRAVDATLREHIPMAWWPTAGERAFGPCFSCHRDLSFLTFPHHVVDVIRNGGKPSEGRIPGTERGERAYGRVVAQ